MLTTSTSQASSSSSNLPSPTWSFSVPSANIKWSNEFRSDYVQHAQSCWDAYTSWYAIWPGHIYSQSISGGTTVTNSTFVVSYTTSSTIYPTTSVSTYKLCDGTPRAHYSPSTTVFQSTLTEVYTNMITQTSPVIPEPQCRPNQDDCAVLYYGTNLTDYPDDSFARIRLYGACGLPLDADFPCLVQGGPVRLLYFPVNTTGGSLCGPDGTTITSSAPLEPVTTLGTTFFPDSAYISFETLYAAYRPFTGPGGAAAQIGPAFSNTIIGFRSDEISTNCYATWWNRTQTANIPGYGPGTMLNFADFNAPIRASAYDCQNQCLPFSVTYINNTYTTQSIYPNPCSTIFDNYNPLLAVPTRLNEMVPQWNKCKFWSPRQANVIFDPPLALTEAPSEATPTMPPAYQDPSPSATAPSPPGPTAPIAEQDDLPMSTPAAVPPPSDSDSQTHPQLEGGVALPNQAPAPTQQDPPSDPKPSQENQGGDPSSGTMIVAGDMTITASYPSGATNVAIVDGQTFSPGGSEVTVNGHMVSMGTQGLVAIDAGAHSSTSSLTTAAAQSSKEEDPSSGQTTAVTSKLPNSASSGTRHTIPFTIVLLLAILSTLAF